MRATGPLRRPRSTTGATRARTTGAASPPVGGPDPFPTPKENEYRDVRFKIRACEPCFGIASVILVVPALAERYADKLKHSVDASMKFNRLQDQIKMAAQKERKDRVKRAEDNLKLSHRAARLAGRFF